MRRPAARRRAGPLLRRRVFRRLRRGPRPHRRRQCRAGRQAERIRLRLLRCPASTRWRSSARSRSASSWMSIPASRRSASAPAIIEALAGTTPGARRRRRDRLVPRPPPHRGRLRRHGRHPRRAGREQRPHAPPRRPRRGQPRPRRSAQHRHLPRGGRRLVAVASAPASTCSPLAATSTRPLARLRAELPVGLEHRADRRPAEDRGGERRRVPAEVRRRPRGGDAGFLRSRSASARA